MLVGTSRKRFIGEILDGAPPEDRLEGTAASVVLAVAAGADVIRVHDVAAITRAVRVADAIVRRPRPEEEVRACPAGHRPGHRGGRAGTA